MGGIESLRGIGCFSRKSAFNEELRACVGIGDGAWGGKETVSFVTPVGQTHGSGNDGTFASFTLPDDGSLGGPGVLRSQQKGSFQEVGPAGKFDSDAFCGNFFAKRPNCISCFFKRCKRVGGGAVAGIGAGWRNVKYFGFRETGNEKQEGAKQYGSEETDCTEEFDGAGMHDSSSFFSFLGAKLGAGGVASRHAKFGVQRSAFFILTDEKRNVKRSSGRNFGFSH